MLDRCVASTSEGTRAAQETTREKNRIIMRRLDICGYQPCRLHDRLLLPSDLPSDQSIVNLNSFVGFNPSIKLSTSRPSASCLAPWCPASLSQSPTSLK